MKKLITIIVVIAVVAGGALYLKYQKEKAAEAAVLISGNGRIEATEISIATKLAGRIDSIEANEGDFIKKGQVLAKIQDNLLQAQMAQAKANKEKAVTAEASARANIKVRESEVEAAKATVFEKESRVAADKKSYERAASLHEKQVISDQELDEKEAKYLTSAAAVATAKANQAKAEAAVESAKADAIGAKAAIAAADADIASIQADLDECLLYSPRDGRIQFRISEPGEVLASGGRVLNLVDLTDVYMTFFVPERVAGKLKIGAEARIVLDAMPKYAIPANISFVASVAQFTPKSVETEIERQKFMFRVKARIKPELLEEYKEFVKTGLPGVAWVKLDDGMEWPANLQLRSK